MNAKELRRILSMVSEDCVIHIEGQEIETVELLERSHCHIKLGDVYSFTGRKVESILNLVAGQVNEG